MVLVEGFVPVVKFREFGLVALATRGTHTLETASKVCPEGQLVHFINFISKIGVVPVQSTHATPL